MKDKKTRFMSTITLTLTDVKISNFYTNIKVAYLLKKGYSK